MLAAGEEGIWVVPHGSGGQAGSGGQGCSCKGSWSARTAFLGMCKPWAAPAHAFSWALRSCCVPPMQDTPWFYDSQQERVDLSSLTFHIWGSNVEQLPSEPTQRPLRPPCRYLAALPRVPRGWSPSCQSVPWDLCKDSKTEARSRGTLVCGRVVQHLSTPCLVWATAICLYKHFY